MNIFNFETLAKRAEFGETGNKELHMKFIRYLQEFCGDTKAFLSIYPRNFVNDKQDELIVFISEGFIRVRQVGERLHLIRDNSKLIRKELIVKRYNNAQNILILTYENGTQLELDSIADSNESWDETYTKEIREIYKKL